MCYNCKKEIIRTSKYRSSSGNNTHYYFCDMECKLEYKNTQYIKTKERQKNLDPELVAKLLKEFRP